MDGTFRSEDKDDYECDFSVLSMRIRFRGLHFSKCACSERKARTRSRRPMFEQVAGALRTFAPIVSAHPYCARKFTRHVIHERAR